MAWEPITPKDLNDMTKCCQETLFSCIVGCDADELNLVCFSTVMQIGGAELLEYRVTTDLINLCILSGMLREQK